MARSEHQHDLHLIKDLHISNHGKSEVIIHKKDEVDSDCGLDCKVVLLTSSTVPGENERHQISIDVTGLLNGEEFVKEISSVDDLKDHFDDLNPDNLDAGGEGFVVGHGDYEITSSIISVDDHKCDVIAVNVTESHEDHKNDVQESEASDLPRAENDFKVATDQSLVENDLEQVVAVDTLGSIMNTVVERRCIGHYNNQQKILLVGEGDFSFASSLADAFVSASNITATSLDSREIVVNNYPQGDQNLMNLEERGATVIHELDAHSMMSHSRLRDKLFDRIIFNFPHAGDTYSGVKESDIWYIEMHQEVVRGFFEEARKMLTRNGQVHVTHKTAYPFENWNIVDLAEDEGLVLKHEMEFWRLTYPGYVNRKSYGSTWNSTFPVGQASTFMFSTT